MTKDLWTIGEKKYFLMLYFIFMNESEVMCFDFKFPYNIFIPEPLDPQIVFLKRIIFSKICMVVSFNLQWFRDTL